MKIDYSKKSKVSFLLSTMLLGAVSLSASVGTVLNNQTLEIDNNYKLNMYYLSNNSQLINKAINNNRLDIENSENSSITNNSSLNVIDDWTAINAKKIENSQIINNGNINILGDSSNDVNINGIDVLNLVNSRVENKGNIISNLNSDATVNGIVVRDAQGSSIKNTGTINLKATGDDLYLQGIHLDGYFASQNSTLANFNNSEIINDKDILVSSKGKLVSSYGITSYDFNINDSQIINNGTISVSSEGVYADSAGMELDSLYNSQIINKGTIKADSTVINNSEDESFADSFAIIIDHSNNSKIENNGSILVNSNKKNEKLTAYAEAISIEEANSLTLENSGTIKSTINNKLDKEAVAILFVNSDKSTVLNKAGGEIHGSVILYGDTTFNNKGSIYLPYNANSKTFRTFDDNDGKGEQTISFQPNFGNFTNSGTIEIGAFKNKNDIIENTQILTKTATFDTSSKMQVAVVEGSKAFVKGDTLSEVVTATDKLTINDLTLNQTKLADNSATLDFKYEIKNNSLDLIVSDVKKLEEIVKPTPEEAKPDNKNVVNKISVAKTLDEFRNNQSLYPKMGTVLSKIDTLSTDSEVVKAINSIVPTTSFVNTSSQITSSVSNIVSNRLGNIKSGLNSGDEIIVDSNRVWIKAFGSLGDQKDKDSISGFDLKTYGLGLGYDKEYKEDQIIGLAAFYTNANVETNGVNHENDVDAYSIVAYGSNLLADDKTTIYYQGSYTWQKNDSKRELFTGEQANADFTSKTVALDLKVGHKININDKFAVEPNIGTTYRHFTNPSYSESGAGALNIQSERFTSSEFIGNIGTDFEYKITPNSKLTATIGAGYDFKDDDNIVTSSFAGASGVSFDTKGIDNGRWNYIAGVGYDVNLDSQNNLNVQYNYQGEGSKYSNNVISLNYMYKF
ncbi:autotransporter outer membrane beta-barrel domain-containing protein [Aliarcobacter butzleri]|uniref:autotransporter family protein n=1 Tax=Aliarcobacter butzleri TaxID=28197 RepID=UPI0021B381DE|nr:autotransporter outer membrane beta-barrel domain-containing protein [Aliarcobacter butzleri]MCT7583517.1 autotransporter outer membrane beta-barrel domain-containing protein [Aliarcobacter butzleri]